MSWQDREEPLGGAVIVALIGLWFAIGLAALEAFFAAFTPDPNLRFFSGLWGLADVAVAIGLQRRRRAAIWWGIGLSGFSYLIQLVTRHVILSTDLLIFVPLLIAAAQSHERERQWVPPPKSPSLGRPRAPWDPWD